jgi:hypothetical protein
VLLFSATWISKCAMNGDSVDSSYFFTVRRCCWTFSSRGSSDIPPIVIFPDVTSSLISTVTLKLMSNIVRFYQLNRISLRKDQSW